MLVYFLAVRCVTSIIPEDEILAAQHSLTRNQNFGYLRNGYNFITTPKTKRDFWQRVCEKSDYNRVLLCIFWL